jgi:hypothetical protein
MPRAYFFTSITGVHLNTPEAVIDAVADRGGWRNALVIVEDIDSSWESALQDAWSLDSAFFRRHKDNPTASDLWQDIMVERQSVDFSDQDCEVHIQGVFEYPAWKLKDREAFRPNDFSRRCWKPPEPYPISSNTKISYLLVDSFCM